MIFANFVVPCRPRAEDTAAAAAAAATAAAAAVAICQVSFAHGGTPRAIKSFITDVALLCEIITASPLGAVAPTWESA